MAILSAGINFGKPNTEFILESDEHGVAQSCRNVDTGIEYVGGGGSSDFSTAEVTFITDGRVPTESIKFSVADSTMHACMVYTLDEDDTYPVILYEGKCIIYFDPDDMTPEVTTGSATIDSDESCFIITGDSTITLHEIQ